MDEKKTIIVENAKKSTMGARGHFDYEKLVYKTPCFLPCTYKEDIEEVEFSYDIARMKPLLEVKKEEKESQYQFLINFKNLEALMNTYKIALTEDNIYYDENFGPFVKHRDLYSKEEQAEQGTFLVAYKTFIGGILGRKYSIKSIQESGLELLKKESAFKEFYEAETADELVEILRKRKNDYMHKMKNTMVKVKKSGNRIKTITTIVTSTLFIAVAGYLGYLLLNTVPFQTKVIEAYEGYTQNDYVQCIDAMETISTSAMNVNEKYMLAVSYAKSESLRKEEIEEIVDKLSLSSNERELEYWIYLGRGEDAQAQNLAQALSNDQLLIYAYMKELDRLERDTTMLGEEKASRISQLEGNIRTLGEKYNTTELEEIE